MQRKLPRAIFCASTFAALSSSSPSLASSCSLVSRQRLRPFGFPFGLPDCPGFHVGAVKFSGVPRGLLIACCDP